MPRVTSDAQLTERRLALIQQQLRLVRDMHQLVDAVVVKKLGQSFSIHDAVSPEQLGRAMEGATNIGNGYAIDRIDGHFDVSKRMQQNPALLNPQSDEPTDPLRQSIISMISEQEQAAAVAYMSQMPVRYSDADLLLRGQYSWHMTISKALGYNSSRTLYNLAGALYANVQVHETEVNAAFDLLAFVTGLANQLITLAEQPSATRDFSAFATIFKMQLDGFQEIGDAQAVFPAVFHQLSIMTDFQSLLFEQYRYQDSSTIADQVKKTVLSQLTAKIDYAVQQDKLLSGRDLNSMLNAKAVRKQLKKVRSTRASLKQNLVTQLKIQVMYQMDQQLKALPQGQAPDSIESRVVAARSFRWARSLGINAAYQSVYTGLTLHEQAEIDRRKLQGDGAGDLSKQLYTAMFRLKNQLTYYKQTAGKRHISMARLERVGLLDCLADTFLEAENLTVEDAQGMIGLVQAIQAQHGHDHSRWFNRTNRLGDALTYALTDIKSPINLSGLSSNLSNALNRKLEAQGVKLFAQQRSFPLSFRYCGAVTPPVHNPYHQLIRQQLVNIAPPRSRTESGSGSPRASSPHPVAGPGGVGMFGAVTAASPENPTQQLDVVSGVPTHA